MDPRLLRALASCLRFGLAFGAVILLLVVGAPRAFYPSLHCDESLYTGAALRMLDGDFFLTHYWLDKTFLGPLLIALGSLIGGRSGLGFHLAGWLCGITAVVILMRALGRLAGLGQPPLRSVLASLVVMAVTAAAFVLPVAQFYLASAFFEPFTLLCVAVMVKHLVLCVEAPQAVRVEHHRSVVYRAFAVGVCCKFTVALWAPVLAGLWLAQLEGTWRQRLHQGVQTFIAKTKLVWLVTLFFMLTNSEKLAPVAWFKNLYSAKPKDQAGALVHLSQHLGAWLGVAAHLVGSWSLLAALLAGLLGISVAVGRAAKQAAAPERCWQLAVIVLPFWLHAVAVWLAGSMILDRYLFLLIPQAIAVLCLGFPLLSNQRWPARLYPAALAVLVALGAGYSWHEFPHRIAYDRQIFYPPAFGRTLQQILDEVPDGSIVHHDNKLWFLYPYVRNGRVRVACQSDLCLKESAYGRLPFDRQYLFYDPPGTPSEAAPAQLFQAVPVGFAGLQSETETVSGLLEPALWRGALRLGGWVQELQVVPGPAGSSQLGASPPPVVSGLNLAWQPVPGAPVQVRVERKQLASFINNLVPTTLLLSGQMTLRPPALPGEPWWLGFRAETLEAVGWQANLVDLAPLLWKGYFIPLKPLDRATTGGPELAVAVRWTTALEAPQLALTLLSPQSD